VGEDLKEEILKVFGIITLGISFRMVFEGDLFGISSFLGKFEGMGKGPMTVLGSIRDAYGYRIALSSIVVLIVQGGIGLLSLIFGGRDLDLSVLNSVGGLILISIAFNLMGLWKIETSNFLMAFHLLMIWYFLPF